MKETPNPDRWTSYPATDHSPSRRFAVPPITRDLVAERMRQRREALGINQVEAARRIGVTPRKITGTESQGDNFSFGFLCRMAEAYGVAPWWFLFGDPAHDQAYEQGRVTGDSPVEVG